MSSLGLALRAVRDPVDAVQRAARGGGAVVTLARRPGPVLLVTHPDLIREVLEERADVLLKDAGSDALVAVAGHGLMFSAGELNARRRAMVEPLLLPGPVGRFAGAVVEAAEAAGDGLVEGQPVEVIGAMRAMTTQALLRSLVGDLTGPAAGELGRAVNEFAGGLWHAFVPGRRLFERVLPGGFRRFAGARRLVDANVHRAVRRRVGARGPGDLLDDLLDARDGRGGMGERGVRDEMLSLLLAGRGTITAALGWTLWLLARHPEVESRLHAEVDDALGGRRPAAQDLNALPYTKAVFEESLRLYSPAWILRRKAVAASRVGRVAIPEGATVLISSFVVQRDPRLYREPLRFDPGRFLDGPGPPHPYAYFPFGGGPRGCPGFAFATMEGVLVLATLARRWRFREVDGVGEPRFARSITLRPRDGLPMRPHRRAG